MIKNISEFLHAIIAQEREKLNSYELKHAPTIGKMYEGLTSEILEKTLPLSLNLQIVGGMVHNGDGTLSGEIDCMLVRGQGEQIPYTNAYKWHIKDVLAIFEVKKNLLSDNLADSFTHLRSVIQSYYSYIERMDKENPYIDLEPARRAYKEITGEFPDFQSDNSDLTNEMIYHTLVMEQISPLRIVIGYNSYKTEFSMRNAFLGYLQKNMMTKGFGVGSFPTLFICGEFSLIKLNGQPYSSIKQDDFWDFYASSNEKPILLLLELIWTKLSNELDISLPWGDDLNDENLARLLSGKIVTKDQKKGWEYKYIEVSDEDLKDRTPSKEWEPMFVDANTFTVFNILCRTGSIDFHDKDFTSFISNAGLDKEDYLKYLQQTGYIAINGNNLLLSTYDCRCVILPDGRYAVAEDNSGRLTRWYEKNYDQPPPL